MASFVPFFSTAPNETNPVLSHHHYSRGPVSISSSYSPPSSFGC